MGTDIHGTFQKKITEGNKERWIDVSHRYKWFRHYFLFGILANVRNGYGFAGCSTGDWIVPIDLPRGIPNDLKDVLKSSNESTSPPVMAQMIVSSVRSLLLNVEQFLPTEHTLLKMTQPVDVAGEEIREVWLGDHDHSWLLGSEMVSWYEANASKEYYHWGYIDIDYYLMWREGERKCPEHYCGDILGRFIKKVDEAEIITLFELTDKEKEEFPEPRVKSKYEDLTNITHVKVRWKVTVGSLTEYFFKEVKRLVDEHGEIRMVFGFDS